ncbi:hypothetical protein MHU86_4222 [Fragilaria crotonensis]|nr:hypothetical protein MHU86_4222 [Fragilaria crotonensis]
MLTSNVDPKLSVTAVGSRNGLATLDAANAIKCLSGDVSELKGRGERLYILVLCGVPNTTSCPFGRLFTANAAGSARGGNGNEGGKSSQRIDDRGLVDSHNLASKYNAAVADLRIVAS